MSDVAILKEMIKNVATVPLETEYDNQVIRLKESSTSSHYDVTIRGIPSDTQVIVLKPDAFTAPKEVFVNSKHECKRADFVIVADTGQKKVIICIEMKAGKGGLESEIIQQLKGAQCFIAYCREIGRAFWDQPNFLKDYEHRFVSMRSIRVNKKPTRLTKNSIHDRPEKMLKLNYQKVIRFDQLVN